MKPHHSALLYPHTLSTRAKEKDVHECENAVETDQLGRRPEWSWDVSRIHAMHPPRVEVEEVEDHVADIRDCKNPEITGDRRAMMAEARRGLAGSSSPSARMTT
jgi:hypothetical protein